MFQNNSQQRGARQGFTLTELLVALTISVVVLGAVFVAFSASTRAIRQGYQQIRGFDLARGTFDILENDLNTAFIQRELGDKHKFFGTPIGFTYVGTANPATGAGAANVPQIARVTYVVYFGDPLNPASGQQGSGRVTIQEIYDGDDVASADPDRFGFGQQVITYSLLRFVEPGVGDLDSWPAVNGVNLWDVLAGGSEGVNQVIAQYLAEPIQGLPFNLTYDYGERDLRGRRSNAPTPEQQWLQDARKRELWIRMLAGDPRLPNLWQILGQNPRDYVVAENIYLPANITPLVPEFNDPEYTFFQYGVAQRQVLRVDAAGNPTTDGSGIPQFDAERLATTGESRWLDGKPDERWHLYWLSAYNLFFDFQAPGDSRNLGLIALNNPASGDPNRWLAQPQVFGQVNLATNFQVNLNEISQDPFVAIANPYNAVDVPGTPYDPQLPEQVHVRFEYLLDSPWAGVSEFKREFDQIVDVPSGLTRKQPPTRVVGL